MGGQAVLRLLILWHGLHHVDDLLLCERTRPNPRVLVDVTDQLLVRRFEKVPKAFPWQRHQPLQGRKTRICRKALPITPRVKLKLKKPLTLLPASHSWTFLCAKGDVMCTITCLCLARISPPGINLRWGSSTTTSALRASP